MISKFCNSAMVIGNSLGQNVISAETVRQAINDSTIV